MTPRHRRHDAVARVVDVAVAALFLILLSPALLAVALLVRMRMGRPVLFRQVRPGRQAQPFTLVKFRTMHHVNPARGLVTDGERLTRLGRLLRVTSLDELPTLWNVLCGQMSLVGPRPLLMQYLPRYSPEQACRHEVRPGVTGLAQVRGRNAISWADKLALDTWYVRHRSIALDLRILARTAVTVLRREGISAAGVETATEFMGTAVAPRRAPRNGRSVDA
jgi:lipopolysaccharide/colanic/teichoic acid biosynthesis glycosyltransferase